ncbi:hypothetical protein [Tropicibacter sp. Alg240-R139]|uniref:hypothetical protein n=1 Tax=Tropicibacter sp. Alg240-R139 TaxID=2305991 RepID=UPI0013DEAA8C|nr:hypothetical protein [Tropicibacter sp. Alg240-R139]
MVNIDSVGGNMALPLGTLYHRTKFAVECLSETSHYEHEPLCIQMKIVEPGMNPSDFAAQSFGFVQSENVPGHAPIIQALMRTFTRLGSGDAGSDPNLVSEVIWAAEANGTPTLRTIAGAEADSLMAARKTRDDETLVEGLKAQFGLACASRELTPAMITFPFGFPVYPATFG